MKKLLLSLLAAGSLAASASAALTATSGDLIIGFYATGGTGQGTSVMIDAGSFTSFIAGNGSTFAIGGFSSTDLVNTYGATWYDRTDLSWGVIGGVKNTQSGTVASSTNAFGTAAGKDTLFATAQNGFGTSSAQSLGASPIQALYTYINGKTANGVGTTTYIGTNSNTTSGSWVFQRDTATNLDFKWYADNSVGSLSMPGVVGTATQDLYETVANDVSGTTGGIYNLGTFSLTSSGLSFTSAVTAVPEPSTYAAIFGVVMLGFAAYRRRFQKKN